MKYEVEIKVNTGYDVQITEAQKEHDVIEDLINLYISNDDFGEIEYDYRSDYDLIPRDDGTYDAHMRLYGTFFTVQTGETREECKEKAVAAYMTADLGSFGDESIEYEIYNAEPRSLSCEILNAHVLQVIENMRTDRIGMSHAAFDYASNMDESHYSVLVEIQDCVSGDVNVSVFKANPDEIDEIYPIFDKKDLSEYIDKSQLIGKTNIVIEREGKGYNSVLRDMLKNIVKGELDKVLLTSSQGKAVTMDKLITKTDNKEIEKE